MTRGPIDEWLEDALRERTSDPSPAFLSEIANPTLFDSSGHLAPEILTDFLARQLEPELRDQIEEHLASCSSCRDWATEASQAMDEQTEAISAVEENHPEGKSPFLASKTPSPKTFGNHRQQKQPDRRSHPSPTQWLAWAATAVLIVGAFYGVGRLGSGPSETSAISQQAELSTNEIETWAIEARRGELPFPELFPDLADTAGGSEVRGTENHLAPKALSPRWSRVTSQRPVFIVSSSASKHELLLVDDQDNLVAAIPFHKQDTLEREFRLALPTEIPDLEPERTYAWKVNRLSAEESEDLHEGSGGQEAGLDTTLASAFVPFTVQSQESQQRLARRLEGTDGDPFQRGLVFLAEGLYSEAMESFAHWPAKPEDELFRRNIQREILTRQKFPPSELDAWLERWSSKEDATP